MVISIQDNLTNLISYLSGVGYEVHYLSEGKISDIYIYSERSMGLMNLSNMAIGQTDGSLIINADDKSNNDILYFIHHRTYSPLF